MKCTFAARTIFAIMAMTICSQPVVALPTTMLAKATAVPYIPVDDSWRSARSALQSASDQELLRKISPDVLNDQPVKQVERINEWVNSTITFVDDSERLNVADHWASARETLNARKGDCEDYAILKMALLHAAGFPLEAMQILIVEEEGRKFHATLMVEIGDGVSILDNRTDEIRPINYAMRGGRFALGIGDQFKLDYGMRRSKVRSGFAGFPDEPPVRIVTTG